ncbi:integral membrane protein [Teratosphaeria destructans]|uniref:Integral membrane protein n=1 Tax=Teratosphaeria destructans TaxID=418781 RepID=A0A9W7SNF1_9PEZI|nr:integral membrane protein [Teratosphaeria destructans]
MPLLNDSRPGSSWTSPNVGVVQGVDGRNLTHRLLVVFFAGLSAYNAVEVITLTFLTFRRYRGMYFWSLLVAGIGIVLASLNQILNLDPAFTGGIPRYVDIALGSLGWWLSVTGQACVLWSRLHIVVWGKQGDLILQWTKWMILSNILMLHLPTSILSIGAKIHKVHADSFTIGYSIMEKIQIAGFFVQETILSSIYIRAAIKIIRTSLSPTNHNRTAIKQLIGINATIIGMDLCLLILEAASLYILQTLSKNLIYSIKLKLEFVILGKLVKTAHGSGDELQSGFGRPPDTCITLAPWWGGPRQGPQCPRVVEADVVDNEIVFPSRSCSRVTALDYDLARFRHVDGIVSLQMFTEHFRDSMRVRQ